MSLQSRSSHQSPVSAEPVGWGWRSALLLVWLLAGFGAMYLVRDMEGYLLLDWPLGYWLAAQGIILVYVGIVTCYAWLANRRERQAARQAMPDAPPQGD